MPTSGIIGFAGWKAYDAKKSADKLYDNASKSEAAIADKSATELSKVSDGFMEDENKGIGIAFHYPKSWGEVLVKKTEGDNKTFQGTDVRLSFTKKSEPNATLRSRNYKIFEGGRGKTYWDAPTEFTINYVKDRGWEGAVGYVSKV